jgi:predicted dehydrogenase
MEKIRINVIGAGHWGPNIVRTFSSIPGVSVGVVSDLDDKRLALIGQNFPWLTITTDAAQALQDPEADAVAIATPVTTHYQLAKAALLAGKHVFVEKPLCRTSEESEELIKLAAEKKRTLMVGHIFLFNPGILKIKEIIDSGALGKIVYIDAVRTNLGPIRNDINALWDLASHDFAIFDFWLGLKPKAVSATARRVAPDRCDDVVFATVQYEKGPIAHVHASWLNPRKVRQITVVGETKMVVWDDIDLTQAVQIYSHGVTLSKDDYSDTFGAHRLKYHTGDLLIPRVDSGEPLKIECLHFIDCVRAGKQPRTDGASAKRVVDILVAADRSLATHGAFASIQ